jgi:hypothetical protein
VFGCRYVNMQLKVAIKKTASSFELFFQNTTDHDVIGGIFFCSRAISRIVP